MIVRVKPARRRGFFIPVPFFILDIYLQAIGDLFILGRILMPFGLVKFERLAKQQLWKKGIDISLVWDIVEEFFSELRKYGRWRMADIKTGDVEVKVDLY